jgi:hypothetical protein
MTCTVTGKEVSSSPEPAWRSATLRCAVQHPLIRTALTLRGLKALRERPRAVTLGIGLSSRKTLTRGIPFDMLGMVLPAEQLRRACGAERLVALIADRHALTNGFGHASVERRAAEVAWLFEAMRAAFGLPLDIVRASFIHDDPRHVHIHEAVRSCAGATHPYVTLEVADTAFLRRSYGSILKVGWALGREQHSVLDERFFDERFRSWVGDDVGFAYCEAGRTLDPARLKAAPYLVIDPARRLLLRPDEKVASKLARFEAGPSEHVRRSVHAHLRRITQVYSRTIEPLRGSLVERVESVLNRIFPGGAASEQPCAGTR